MRIHRLTIHWTAGPTLTRSTDSVADEWWIVDLTAPKLAAWLLAQKTPLAWNIASQMKAVSAALLAWPVDYFAESWDGLQAEGIAGAGNRLDWVLTWRGLPILVRVERFDVTQLE